MKTTYKIKAVGVPEKTRVYISFLLSFGFTLEKMYNEPGSCLTRHIERGQEG